MNSTDLDELARRLRGLVGAADSPLAESAAQVFDVAARRRRPAAVVRARSTEDVAVAMQWAHDTGAVVAIRSGGHSFDGFSVHEDTLMLDLRALDAAELLDDGSVTVGPGARVRAVAETLSADGRALPLGNCPSVGLGGLVSGGGFGFLSRYVGLTIDSLVEATVVLPDGAVVRCSADEQPDLFWACRGGAGCVGVVTEMRIGSLPVSTVVGIDLTVPWERAVETYVAYADTLAAAPDTLDLKIELRTTGPGRFLDTRISGPPGCVPGTPHVKIDGHLVGTIDEAHDLLARLTSIERMSAEVREMSYWDAVLLEIPLGDLFGNPSPSAVRPVRVASDFSGTEDVDRQARAIIEFVERLQQDPALHGGGALVEPADGAIARPAATATAFPHRNSSFLLQWEIGHEVDVSAEDDGLHDDVLATLRAGLGDALTGGRYVNYADRLDGSAALWGENVAGLESIVDRVDPEGVLHSRLRPCAPREDG